MTKLLRIGTCLLLASVAPALGSASAMQQRQEGARHNAAESLEQIIQVEIEFAQDSVRSAIKRSFLRYVAPDGVIFRPRPVPAPETFRSDPDDDPSEGFLDWWPVMAGVSQSGDLGFSVGPWHQHLAREVPNYPTDTFGYYCTIWRRQPDGSWKFVIDGAGAFLRTTAPTRPRGSPVSRLPISAETRAVGADGALAEVRQVEVELAAQARTDARAALAAHYIPDAWVMGSHVEVMPGRVGWQAELARRPARLSLEYVGGGASAAGDVAYTYGLVESADPATSLREATYLHIWMRREGQWRLVFDGIKQRRSFE